MKRITFGLLSLVLALSLAPQVRADNRRHRQARPAEQSTAVDRNSFASPGPT